MIKKLKVPHTLVLLYGMILLAYVLTLLLPAGQFETMMNEHGHEIVVPGTYAVIPETESLPLTSLFTVIPRGLESAQGIIFFVRQDNLRDSLIRPQLPWISDACCLTSFDHPGNPRADSKGRADGRNR